MLQDGLPVKFQDVKFKDPKFKHDIFARIDMKLKYFIICFQSIFSLVEIIIELFVVSCLCIIFVIVILKVTNHMAISYTVKNSDNGSMQFFPKIARCKNAARNSTASPRAVLILISKMSYDYK